MPMAKQEEKNCQIMRHENPENWTKHLYKTP